MEWHFNGSYLYHSRYESYLVVEASVTMTGSAILAASCGPVAHNVTGGNNCPATGITVGLDGAESGVSYQLFRNGNSIGSPMTGQTGAFNFGLQTTPGTYTIVGTQGTSLTMTGSATVYADAGTVSVTPSSANNNFPGPGTSLTASNTGAASAFTWSPTSGLTPSSGATVNANPALTTNYTVTATTIVGGCISTATVLVNVSNCSINTWLGTTSADWFDATNWSCYVPSATTSAVIQSGRPNYPTIGGGTPQIAAVKDLTIQSGASINVAALNGTLTIYGNFSNSGASSLGAGPVQFLGTSAQTISGVNSAVNVTINNSHGISITAGGSNQLKVSGVLALATGSTLTTNGNLTIASDASGTGVIDNFTSGNSGSISGNLTVQRYVNNPNGASYFVGGPVGGATISQWGTEFSLATMNGADDGSAGIAYQYLQS